MNNLQKEKEYLPEIDVLKAIGIVLVVIGHSFPDASSDLGISNVMGRMLYDIIYSFHMPAFVFASGIVSYKFYQSISLKKTAIKKRAIRLVIPYFVWAVIYIPFRIILANFSSESFVINQLWKVFLGNNPYSGLWFLYALFLISLLQIMLVDNDMKLTLIFILSIIGSIVNDFVVISEPIRWIFAYSFYYFAGMIFRKYYIYLGEKFLKKIIQLLLILIFCFLFLIKIRLRANDIYSFNVLPAIAGTLMAYSISCILKNNEILKKMGAYSMDIYILSGPILVALRIGLYRILGMNYVVYTSIAIVLGCMLPVLISTLIIRKNCCLSLLLLGMI